MTKRISKAWQAERLALGLKYIASGKIPKIAKDGAVSTKPCVPCQDVPESTVLEEIGDNCRRYGLRVKRLNNGAGVFKGSDSYRVYGIIGGGDYLGWTTKGRHIEVECKAGKGGRLSKVQQARFTECWDCGAIFIVVHGLPELDYFGHIGWERITREQASCNIRFREE